jgi:hypothetical protein
VVIVKELLRIADDPTWIASGNRKNISLYRMEGTDSSPVPSLCQKACGRVPATPKRIKDILIDSVRERDGVSGCTECLQSQFKQNKRSAYDPLCVETQEIEHLDSHSTILYNKVHRTRP